MVLLNCLAKHEIRKLHLFTEIQYMYVAFCNKHRKHIRIITWPQLHHSLFTTACTHSSFTKSHDASYCVKNGSCSLWSMKWKSVESTAEILYILLSQQRLAAIKLDRWWRFCISASTGTLVVHTANLSPAVQNSQLPSSWAMASNSPELNSIDCKI